MHCCEFVVLKNVIAEVSSIRCYMYACVCMCIHGYACVRAELWKERLMPSFFVKSFLTKIPERRHLLNTFLPFILSKRVTHPLSPLHETSDYVVCTNCYFYNHSVLLLGVLFGWFVCLFFKQYNSKPCQSECILIEDTPPASPASQKILKTKLERAYLVRKYWGYKCKTS